MMHLFVVCDGDVAYANGKPRCRRAKTGNVENLAKRVSAGRWRETGLELRCGRACRDGGLSWSCLPKNELPKGAFRSCLPKDETSFFVVSRFVLGFFRGWFHGSLESCGSAQS